MFHCRAIIQSFWMSILEKYKKVHKQCTCFLIVLIEKICLETQLPVSDNQLHA